MDDQQTTLPSFPGAIATLRQSWEIFKQNPKTFIGIMLLQTALIMPISLLLSAYLTGGKLLGFLSLQPPSPADLEAIGNPFSKPYAIQIFILFFIIQLIIQIWSSCALLFAIKDPSAGIGFIEAYRRGWCKILPFFWVYLLIVLIVGGGFLLFMIPGIAFTVWFSLAFFILITEDQGGMRALLRSREYVRNHYLGVFWRFLFLLIMELTVLLLFWLLTLFLTRVGIPFVPDLLNIVLGIFLVPLMMIYAFQIYRNLRALKGEITVDTTRGRKLKYLLVGLIGLISMLVVIGISIYSLRALGSYDVTRQEDLTQIQSGLQTYFGVYSTYPDSLEQLSPDYLPTLPLDPLTQQPYQYQVRPDGYDYQICVQMTQTDSPKCVTSQD